ncbi:hypothetical protein [Sporomusa malonica]|uniref:Uncharacterized protein n=1 Tax=Sporomusa malonica TaxID=112901 RepID=A0A1W2F2S0_9FIRM|nr:hypothetical protein [Sporomusa malonica]SMD15796.1 hypothetical protein SAMN04488500_1395 [Sporomusa malonica]
MSHVRLIIGFILLCLMGTINLSLAAAKMYENPKKNVALIIINDKKLSRILDKQMNSLLVEPITQQLSYQYHVSVDNIYYEKLKAAGYSSIISLERSDIIETLAAENLDYAILIEALPFTKGYNPLDGDLYQTWMYHMHMEIIDFENNKTLYNGNFNNQAGSIGNQSKVEPMTKQMVKIVFKKLI